MEFSLESNMKTLKLPNGNTMPFIGLGTSNLGENEEDLLRILNLSLDVGYRLFDTANGYNNEAVIGRFIRNLPIKRSEVFISSKLNDDAHSYSASLEAVEKTLYRLNTEYIDLFLVHNPNSQMMRMSCSALYAADPNYWIAANQETWLALEECYKKGLIKNIGVSNFEERHLSALIRNANVLPTVNQIRYCLGCYKTQKKLIEYCASKSVLVQAYSPFGKGNALRDPNIISLSKEKSCSPELLILSYLNERNIPAVIRASSKPHLSNNLSQMYVCLDEKDMALIEAIIVDENWAKIKNPETGEKYN